MRRLRGGLRLCHFCLRTHPPLSQESSPWTRCLDFTRMPPCHFELPTKTAFSSVSLPTSLRVPVMISLSCGPHLKSLLLYSFPSSLGSNLSPAPPNTLFEVFLPSVPSTPPSFIRLPSEDRSYSSGAGFPVCSFHPNRPGAPAYSVRTVPSTGNTPACKV